MLIGTQFIASDGSTVTTIFDEKGNLTVSDVTSSSAKFSWENGG